MTDDSQVRIDNMLRLVAGDPNHREFLQRMRDALLAEVDAIERLLAIYPTTSEIRREYKDTHRRCEY